MSPTPFLIVKAKNFTRLYRQENNFTYPRGISPSRLLYIVLLKVAYYARSITFWPNNSKIMLFFSNYIIFYLFLALKNVTFCIENLLHFALKSCYILL